MFAARELLGCPDCVPDGVEPACCLAQAAFVGVPLGLGLLVGFISQPAVLTSWYALQRGDLGCHCCSGKQAYNWRVLHPPRYRNLKKPSWQPPAFLFGETQAPYHDPVHFQISFLFGLNVGWCLCCCPGPVWSILYVLMGLSSWMVWTHGGLEKQKVWQVYHREVCPDTGFLV